MFMLKTRPRIVRIVAGLGAWVLAVAVCSGQQNARPVRDWVRDGGVLILVSLLAAPYCWPYDQAIALPALLQGAYATRSRMMLSILALASVPIMAALMASIKITTPFYLFIAPAWLAWYLAARLHGERPIMAQPSVQMVSHAGGPQ